MNGFGNCDNTLTNFFDNEHFYPENPCNQVVSCGTGTVTCIMFTAGYKCTGIVEWSCDNNNSEIYDPDKYDITDCPDGQTIIKCPIAVDGCGAIVTCVGNCNTGSYSGYKCKLATAGTNWHPCKAGEITGGDPTQQTCGTGCDNSCAAYCTTGCTGNCVDHGSTCTTCVDSCTTGCRDGGTGCTCLSCTSGCTTGCTTGHLCYFWQ